jgi:hypothetical protein
MKLREGLKGEMGGGEEGNLGERVREEAFEAIATLVPIEFDSRVFSPFEAVAVQSDDIDIGRKEYPI